MAEPLIIISRKAELARLAAEQYGSRLEVVGTGWSLDHERQVVGGLQRLNMQVHSVGDLVAVGHGLGRCLRHTGPASGPIRP